MTVLLGSSHHETRLCQTSPPASSGGVRNRTDQRMLFGNAVKDFLLRKTLSCHCFGVFRRSSAFAPDVEHTPRTACPKTAKQWHVRIAFPFLSRRKILHGVAFRVAFCNNGSKSTELSIGTIGPRRLISLRPDHRQRPACD